MGRQTISMPTWMRDQIDRRRETDQEKDDFQTITDYVQESLQARFEAEDTGEWEPVDVEPPNSPVPDGGTDR